MSKTTYKIAEIADWDMLHPFYASAYRESHPLQDKAFWDWQFGDQRFGRAIIGIQDDRIISHLGIQDTDNKQFAINLFVDPDFRQGDEFFRLLEKSYEIAPSQIGLSLSADATPLFRMLKWYQYADLERRFSIAPAFKGAEATDLIKPVPPITHGRKPEGHFWEQPTLDAVRFDDGSTAIVQAEVGGIRFVDLVHPKKAASQAFEMGFRWCDYITSFNNPILLKLQLGKWQTQEECGIPWLLNPVVTGSKARLSFFSNKSFDLNFYITRQHSDLGRVGRILK